MSAGYMAKCSSGGRPKQRFATRAEAEAFRSSMIGRSMWTRQESNTYPCNQCQGYHAGHLGAINRGSGKPKNKKAKPHLDTQ